LSAKTEETYGKMQDKKYFRAVHFYYDLKGIFGGALEGLRQKTGFRCGLGGGSTARNNIRVYPLGISVYQVNSKKHLQHLIWW